MRARARVHDDSMQFGVEGSSVPLFSQPPSCAGLL